MKFMLMSFESNADFALRTNDENMEKYWSKWASYFNEMEEEEILVNPGNILCSGNEAITIKPDNNQSEGPYVNLSKQLSGYWVIDVTDINQAIKWANKAPATMKGAVEIRPVWQ